MSIRLVNADRDTPMMFPAGVQELLPENHPARFIVETIEQPGMSAFKVNGKGSGDGQYAPGMMPMLLIYCYSAGIFSSRKINESTYCSVPVMYISAG